MARFYSSQLQQMLTLRHAYQTTHVGATNDELPTEFRCLPEALALSMVKKSDSFFYGRYCQVDFELQAFQLRFAEYHDTSAAVTRYPLNKLTFSIIAESIQYIAKRENNCFHRDWSWRQFGNIQQPRYYFIFVVCSRLKTLATRSVVDSTTIVTLSCLYRFVQAVIEAADLFPTRNHQGFHYVLSQTSSKLIALIDHAKYYAQHCSMTALLIGLGDRLKTYRTELATFLLFVVSEHELPDSLHATMLDGEASLLPASFKKSGIFAGVRNALLFGSINQVMSLNLHAGGVTKLLLSKENLPKLTAAFNPLLNTLIILDQLAKQFVQLAEMTKLKGEFDLLHDELLYGLLATTTELAGCTLANAKQQQDCLLQQAEQVFIGRENFKPGFPRNKEYAKAKALQLTQTASQVEVDALQMSRSLVELKKIQAAGVTRLVAQEALNHCWLMVKFAGQAGLLNSPKEVELQASLPVPNGRKPCALPKALPVATQRNCNQALLALCQQSLTADTLEVLNALLQKMMELLLQQNYCLYGGGKDYRHALASYQLPERICQMLDYYYLHIRFCDSFIECTKLRDALFDIACKASNSPPSYCYGLFNPRSSKTQALYNAFANASFQDRARIAA